MINQTPQQPALGIAEISNWERSKSYKVICSCGDNDHEHNVWIEAEDTGISVLIYVKSKSPWWSSNRFKQIWLLLTKGYLEEETVITMSQQQALNYADILRSAIQDVERFKKSTK